MEFKAGKKFWLSRFFSSQDFRLEKMSRFFSDKASTVKRKIKFIVYVQIPFLAGFFIRKSVIKIIDRTQEVKDNVRGKIKIKSENVNASPFLKEIAKIKGRRHKGQNLID